MSDAVTIQLTPMKPSSCSNGSAGSTRAATVRSAIKLNSGCYGTYTGRSNRTSWHHSIRSTNDSSHKHGVECATQKTDRPHSKRKPRRTFAWASVRECHPRVDSRHQVARRRCAFAPEDAPLCERFEPALRNRGGRLRVDGRVR
jgi:hypothetical protein